MQFKASGSPFAGYVCNHLRLGDKSVDADITFSDVPAAAPVAVHLTAGFDADPGALYVNMASWKRSVKALAQAADLHAPRQMSIVRTSEPGSTPLALRFTLFTADGRLIPPLDVELVVRLPGCVTPALLLLQPAHPSDQLSCIQHSC